ncbi:MAG: nucleotidyl transferase AbiEii/AbiGii toxin family protein [Candidatus Omnitrophica bacterium]|nr:nucleotidyl transferase AbiEii/AbiGii toxin family protein [Candidatus Omnitrophota bacterium]
MKNVKNIEASVRGRLQNTAQNTKRQFAEVLQYYGMERFLYRLSKSEHRQRFILKGALMFTVWDVQSRRTTVDIDFLAYADNAIPKMENIIREVCETEVVPDGVVFDPKSVKGEKIKEDADYEGVRVKFRGNLGTARISMQIDIGFGDTVVPKPTAIDYPVILDFPKPHLVGYTFETVVAEKFEAMIKLGALNSRMKDYYDVWLLIRQFTFNGTNLANAIAKTFNNRKTEPPKTIPFFAAEIYNEQSDRNRIWKAFLEKNDIHAPEKLKEAASVIENFLQPVVESIIAEKDFESVWKMPGPWKESIRK